MTENQGSEYNFVRMLLISVNFGRLLVTGVNAQEALVTMIVVGFRC